MFDSQNNNKGGYCWGPSMTFYEGSLLQVEWTAQHGCGSDHPNVDCDLILQYVCHPLVRDGLVTDEITEATVNEKDTDPRTGESVYKYGMHEPFEYWNNCKQRQRNGGLFIADQGVPANARATRSRQQNNDQPHGFECEEERVYYPYWHPTPWRDIAILTSTTGRCGYFKSNSQNVAGKFQCSLPPFNNQEECEQNSGIWTLTRPWGIEAPDCVPNAFSRDNHLGNVKTGYTASYSWVIPRLSDLDGSLNADKKTATCALRIRYNMSSTDYEPWNEVDHRNDMVNHLFNGKEKSPVTQDPYVGYGKDKDNYEWELRLAVNTQQFCRTFQDRSHAFTISQRPGSMSATQRIINLNVRGKRGNIVEVYPAVEYDFVPNQLILNAGDYVHFQWTGCDTNPNYAGEGAQRTDRSNIVQLFEGRDNYPRNFSDQMLFDDATAFRFAHLNQFEGKVCKTEGETDCCKTRAQLTAAGGNIDQNVQNCAKLNDPKAAYFNGGLIEMKAGYYQYMSSRNNNFSNRSQKGYIDVRSLLPVWGLVLCAAGAAAFIGAAILAAGVYYAQTHPGAAGAALFANARV